MVVYKHVRIASFPWTSRNRAVLFHGEIALGFINTVDMKIWTAEDPVEITQKGLRQVQVHPKIDFTGVTDVKQARAIAVK